MNQKTKRILKKLAFYAVFAVFLTVFLVCAYKIGSWLIDNAKADSHYTSLQDDKNNIQVERPTNPTTVITQPGETPAPTLVPETTPAPELVTITHPETGEPMEILPEYAEIFQKNTDMVGWICIPGTKLDYPVVQSPKQVNYYLYRNFYKEYNKHGCIYAREQCEVDKPSDNITLYGHRMQDGSMFATLVNYTKKDFFEKNRYIYFDTLTERHNYEIIAVFKTTATLGEGFQYHLFVDAANEASFDSFIQTCKAESFYETGATAQYGDKLITLSTCEYSQDNGRLVIVAKRIA